MPNNRGNYGNNRGNYRNGNRNGGYNRSQGNDDGKYLNPSSSKKFIHYNNEPTDPNTGRAPKQRVDFSETETEEISFSLTPEKVQDLIARLEAAANDNSGTGGAYISLYCKKSQNHRTGETFDGINILINKQNPPDERFQRGSFRGNAGGGRREYPPQNGRTSHGNANNTYERNANTTTARTTGTEPTTRDYGNQHNTNNTNYSEPEF